MRGFGSFLIIAFLLLCCPVQGSREGDVVLTIGDESFELGEFWHIYNKNRHLPGFDESPAEFAERFIDYKLKVREAKALGLDTLSSFRNEYQQYVNEVRYSYLVDSIALMRDARESYSYMKYVVRASHILILTAPDASPEDTMAAYSKINQIREMALAGEDFAKLARVYSQDPSVEHNSGDLGYFTAFVMIAPFEKAAFSTPVGEISPVIRTDYGYHLIKVFDKQPNKGRIRTAHIMKRFESGNKESEASAKLAADSIYTRLLSNESFDTLVKEQSEDKGSVDRNGELFPFTLDEMIPEFALAAFALEKDGDISEPVRTDFGWHIIKRLGLDPLASFEEESEFIIDMLWRQGRVKVNDWSTEELARNSSDFRYLIREYYDGLLIYEISDRMIWQAAGADSAGLHKYYLDNINEFMYPPVLEGVVAEVWDGKLQRKLMRFREKNPGASGLVQILKDLAGKPQQYSVVEGRFDFINKASNPVAPSLLPRTSELYGKKGLLFWEGVVSEPVPMPFKEALGTVLNSYQNKMEREWVKELREKYKPVFRYELIGIR